MARVGKGALSLVVSCCAMLCLRPIYQSFSEVLVPLHNDAAASFQAPRVDSAGASTNFSKTTVAVAIETALPPIITWTNYGWNHPTDGVGLNYFRSLRSKDLVQGMQSHGWYDASAWQRLAAGTADPHRAYYVFIDFESCVEQSWPRYGHNWDGNADTEFNRSMNCLGSKHYCRYLPVVMQIVAAYPWAKIITPECEGLGPPGCMTNSTLDVSLASISARYDRIRPSIDQGLPPPPVNPTNLTDAQVQEISTCQSESKRKFLLTFSGNYRHYTRKVMKQLHRPPYVITIPNYHLMRRGTKPYQRMMVRSKFAACPRGDNLFSYRFTEILSAGAIPVVWADGWVLPFRRELVDWAKCCAVIIPERDINTTIAVLESISEERRCEMRRNGYRVYKEYMETAKQQISGLVEGLELLRKNERSDLGMNWMQ